MKRAQKEAEQSGRAWQQREQEFEALKLEVDELTRAVALADQQRADSAAAAERLRAELQAARELHAGAEVGAGGLVEGGSWVLGGYLQERSPAIVLMRVGSDKGFVVALLPL